MVSYGTTGRVARILFRTNSFILKLLLLAVYVESSAKWLQPACGKCRCSENEQIVNCSGLGLSSLPVRLPPNAVVLDFSHNELRDFPLSIIYHSITARHVQKVYLHHNELSDIGAFVFKNWPSLRLLDLGYNKLNTLPAKMFLNTNRLTELNLSHCNIERISPNSFAGCNLSILDLSYNRLTSIGRDQLRGVSEQPSLIDLSHNELQSVSANNGLPNRQCPKPYLHLGHDTVCSNTSTVDWTKEYHSCVICAKDSNYDTKSIVLGLVISAVIVLLIALAIRFKMRRQQTFLPLSRYEKVSFLGPRKYSDNSLTTDDSLDSFMIEYKALDIRKKIAIGGYGSVYKAKLNGMTVAVKKLVCYPGKQNEIHDMVREATLLGKLHHANIVRLIAVCSDPSNMCIVTELALQGSVRTYLKTRNERIKWPEKLRMLHDAANGVLYLHTRHPPVIHRDLKSSNLLLDANWRVKVCDFGVSKCKSMITFYKNRKPLHEKGLGLGKMTESSGHTKAPGTLRWTAPEFLSNRPKLTVKSDVYSFGMVMWEFASASFKPPADPKARKEYLCPFPHLIWSHEVADAILRGERPLIPSVCIPSVRDLIYQCWQNNYANRPDFKLILASLAEIAIEQGSDLTETSDGSDFASEAD
ncbi:uncharacterized protein [Oscarella lobularis]|uniref:uncharacterized protein n=1 Tax=Oscarella lobularis TaxID=121494 RepID=UPI0033142DAE